MDIQKEYKEISQLVNDLEHKLQAEKKQSNQHKKQFEQYEIKARKEIHSMQIIAEDIQSKNNTIQQRIQNILNLDQSFDISEKDLNSSSPELAIEVFEKKKIVSQYTANIDLLRKSIDSKVKEIDNIRAEANLSLEKCRIIIDQTINELETAQDRRLKLLKVIDPDKHKAEKSKNKENNTQSIIIHIVVGALSIPFFGVIGVIAVAINYWRLIRKWDKESSYKSNV